MLQFRHDTRCAGRRSGRTPSACSASGTATLHDTTYAVRKYEVRSQRMPLDPHLHGGRILSIRGSHPTSIRKNIRTKLAGTRSKEHVQDCGPSARNSCGSAHPSALVTEVGSSAAPSAAGMTRKLGSPHHGSRRSRAWSNGRSSLRATPAVETRAIAHSRSGLASGVKGMSCCGYRRTVSAGQVARRTTWLVVDPNSIRSSGFRPCTPMTIRSGLWSVAARRISRYGLPWAKRTCGWHAS